MATAMEGPGLHEIARDVYAWIGPEGRTNAGFVVWDDGVLVIDSLYGPTLTVEWMEQIRSITYQIPGWPKFGGRSSSCISRTSV